MSQFAFGAPLRLLALLVVPLLLAFAVAVRRRRTRYTVAFTNLELLGAVVARRRPRWWRRASLALLALALACAGAALAKPHVQVSRSERGATIVLLADVSGSMEATDVRPARIYAAVRAMREFVDSLPPFAKVGLVAFSDKADVITPPTTDRAALASGLDVLSPEGGTALSVGVIAAVKLAVSSLAAQGIRKGPDGFLPAAIVLESDGAQDRGTVTPLQAAHIARDAGVRIYGVALGTRHGYVTQGTGLLTRSLRVPPSPGTVSLLARESGGQAYRASDSSQLDDVYRQLAQASIAHVAEQKPVASWFELAAGVLLAAAVLLARARGAALP